MLGSRAPRCQMPSRLGRHLQRETGLFQSPELELYLTRVTDAAPQTTGVSKKWGISSLVLKPPSGCRLLCKAPKEEVFTGIFTSASPREKSSSKNAEEENERFKNNDRG